MSSKKPLFLWDEFCYKKRNPASSYDFIHAKTGEQPLGIHGCLYKPPQVSTKHKTQEIHTTSNLDDDDIVFHDRNRVLNEIKLCGNEKDIGKVRRVHAHVLETSSIPEDVYVSTALITTYAKCGAMEEAQRVFEMILARNVVSWNALISGYAKNGLCNEALKCFRRMREVGVYPSAVTYICILKACGIVGCLEIGEDIDAEVTVRGLLEKEVMLGNALVDMYCKCGAIEKARNVFELLPERNVVTWSALIAGYAQNGLGNEALKCFRQMKDAGVCPNMVTYICALKACSITLSLEIGEEIHAEARNTDLLQRNIMFDTALIDMYAKCGALEKAREVFEKLPVQDVVSWNALIAGYAQNGLGNEALKCFQQMKDEGIHPNAVTYICILKACSIVGCLEIGEAMDVEVRKQGLLEKDVMLGNTLVDMYAKCGSLEKAREVFEQLPERNIVSWSALIAGYAQHERGDEALKCFRQMKDVGVSPNVVTYICLLKACGIVGSLEIGEDIDMEVRKKGLLMEDIVLGNALVDMYSRCGALEKAQEVLKQLPKRDVVSWNAMIAGYVQMGFGDEALNCFRQMKNEAVCPNVVTYICILKACGMAGSLEIAENVEVEIRKQGLLGKDIMLGNALVDMYSKFGALGKTQEIFEELPKRDVVSWNALVSGYGQLGQANVVLELYTKMRDQDVMPNSVTFLLVLNACSHAGLVKEGEMLFNEMCSLYCLTPNVEHYTCMIDLFGRAGFFGKVKMLLEKVPYSDHLPLLQSILGACRKWTNVNLGRWAFEQSLQLDERCATVYVCMANIYAAAGMQREADKIKALSVRNKA